MSFFTSIGSYSSFSEKRIWEKNANILRPRIIGLENKRFYGANYLSEGNSESSEKYDRK